MIQWEGGDGPTHRLPAGPGHAVGGYDRRGSGIGGGGGYGGPPGGTAPDYSGQRGAGGYPPQGAPMPRGQGAGRYDGPPGVGGGGYPPAGGGAYGGGAGGYHGGPPAGAYDGAVAPYGAYTVPQQVPCYHVTVPDLGCQGPCPYLVFVLPYCMIP